MVMMRGVVVVVVVVGGGWYGAVSRWGGGGRLSVRGFGDYYSADASIYHRYLVRPPAWLQTQLDTSGFYQ